MNSGNVEISSQPVAANGLIYWGSWDGVEHATDPITGNNVWTVNLGQSSGSCDNATYGVLSSATVASVPMNGVATTVVFVGGGRADLYALDANKGTVLWHTNLATAPAHFVYSSTAVFSGSVYVGVASLGDCPLSDGSVVQVNASTGQVQHTFHTVPQGCVGASVWGSPTIDEANGKIYFATGNAAHCPISGGVGESLVELTAADLSLVASWQVPAAQAPGDSDFGSTPTLFQATINGVSRFLVGVANKNGSYYALDRTNLSAGPLWQVKLAVGGASPEGGQGSISASAYDGTYVYAAGGSTTIQGKACGGSVRALDPATGAFHWESCLAKPVLAPVSAVPGLLVVGNGPNITILDAATGKQVYTYLDASHGSLFWGAASISKGVLYQGNLDGKLYALGLSSTPVTTPTPTATSVPLPPAVGPVNTTWYFAEGKVGQGFTEFLTIQNPDPTNSCTVNLQYLLSTSTPAPRSITVAPDTRFTESVNADLSTPASSTSFQAVSTIVSVSNPATCKGVVAERPIYFTNFKGVSSGTDVLGATHTGTNFYFADVSSLPGYQSYITILNPPGGATASISATYSLGGTVLGSDTLTVLPGTRGTIIPKSFSQRVATWVHSSAPVVVERPTYFSNYSGGNAQRVSGAASVVGAPTPATDWRFAEGYTGGGFQENLLLANFGTSAASGTLVLEYDNGSTLTNTVSVPAQDVISIDVNNATANKLGTCAPTPCVLSHSVSAEITVSSGAIVAEREMFFQYTHADRLTGRTVSAQGGTDVTGQSGPARATAYSFAEGYTNLGFDEWLTVQNPTATAETLTVTLVNGKSHAYTFTLPVSGHTRATVNLVDAVVQHLFQATDGVGGYEVSLAVKAGGVFVAERPMYWNAIGTQGASDIIGYSGG